jgi:hypothetical protein
MGPGRGDGFQQCPSTTESRSFSQASDARRRAGAIAGDPQERDLHAKILVEQTLQEEAAVASLYLTTQAQTLAVPASAMRPRSPSSQIAAFARCLADDRDAIVRVAAR